jgi:phosphoribosylaminoimidazole-succinocarboxamide synthase
VQIILADEISPDSCRLWDAITNEVLDKDRFRRDMGQVKESYQEVARRLGVLPDGVVLGRMDTPIPPEDDGEDEQDAPQNP